MTIREQIAAWPGNPTLNPDKYARAPGESFVYWCRRAEAAECRLATADAVIDGLLRAESGSDRELDAIRDALEYQAARALDR